MLSGLLHHPSFMLCATLCIPSFVYGKRSHTADWAEEFTSAVLASPHNHSSTTQHQFHVSLLLAKFTLSISAPQLLLLQASYLWSCFYQTLPLFLPVLFLTTKSCRRPFSSPKYCAQWVSRRAALFPRPSHVFPRRVHFVPSTYWDCYLFTW